MSIKALPLAALVALAALVYFVGPAHAKGPFQVVVFGGDLSGKVVIPAEEIDRLFQQDHGFFPSSNPGRTAPASLPKITYVVNRYQVLEDGTRNLEDSWIYYPAHGDEGARFRDENGWFAIDLAFEDLLNRYIASAPSGASTVEESDTSDRLSPVWYIAPSLAAVVVAAAAVIIGQRLLRRPKGA